MFGPVTAGSCCNEIAERQLAGFLDRGAIDRDDRVRRFDVDATDVRTRDGDGLELLIVLVLRRILRKSRGSVADHRRCACVQRKAHGFEKLVAR
ncbi:MAG: hypothetical protein QM764_17800 [Chitinophagaceae bacterium]